MHWSIIIGASQSWISFLKWFYFQLYYLPLLLVLLRNSVGNNNEELLWKMNLTPGRHRATTLSLPSAAASTKWSIYITGFWGLDGGDGTTLSEVHLTGKLDRVSCFNWFWKISQLSYFQYTDHLSLLVSLCLVPDQILINYFLSRNL